MSGQIKLSEIFYVNPTSLPIPHSISAHHLQTPTYIKLKEDILRKGFDSKCPIIIRLGVEGTKGWKGNNMQPIANGNHRLAIALELNLDYVPVRFEYMNCN